MVESIIPAKNDCIADKYTKQQTINVGKRSTYPVEKYSPITGARNIVDNTDKKTDIHVKNLKGTNNISKIFLSQCFKNTISMCNVKNH